MLDNVSENRNIFSTKFQLSSQTDDDKVVKLYGSTIEKIISMARKDLH